MPRSPRRHPSRRTAGVRGGGLALLPALLLFAAACSSGSSTADAPSRTTAASAPTSSSTAPAAARTAPAALVAARPFTVQEPPGYDPATPAPLLILLHGYGSTGARQERYLKLGPAAAAHGMLFVVPDGTKNRLGRLFWNATDACCGPGSTVDDSAYLSAVIADVRDRYAVDPARVYLAGHSNGGFMSYRMACDHADVIAALVSIAGATYDDAARCRPSEPVATLEVHGTADRTILYDGGSILDTPYPSAPQTVRTWAGYDGCRLTSTPGTPPTRTIVEDLPPAEITVYADGCRGNGIAELWTQPEGSHIPAFTPTFPEQVVEFLLAHPKR
jgi:polyhydroxybutyrate depolymerase